MTAPRTARIARKSSLPKVAVVTGASRGIGREVAEELASSGYSIALLGRSKRSLDIVGADLAKRFPNVEARTFPVDVSKERDVLHAVKMIFRSWARIDVLFNSAGVLVPGTIEPSNKELRKVYDTNVFGTMNLLRAVVPIMKRQRSGYIFNMSSRAGVDGLANWGAYGGTKFAVSGISESLLKELAPFGIKVTCLCPSRVLTDMGRESDSRRHGKEMLQPSDIAISVRYLLSLSPAAVVGRLTINCVHSL